MTSPPTASLVSADEGKLSRRALLLGTSAVAVATVLPASGMVAAVEAPAFDPMWIVGTPGESDWGAVRAPSVEMARRFYAVEYTGDDGCDSGQECCEGLCEFCIAFDGYEARRMPRWDTRQSADISNADWIAADMEGLCDRCGYECSLDDGAQVVADKAICESCLTLADWDIVDPERAAELRAEQEPDTPVSSDTPTAVSSPAAEGERA